MGACAYKLFGRVILIEFTSGMSPADAVLLILLEPPMSAPFAPGLLTLLVLVRERGRRRGLPTSIPPASGVFVLGLVVEIGLSFA